MRRVQKRWESPESTLRIDRSQRQVGHVFDRPELDRWDYATIASVLALLLVGYVLYPDPILQYGVWLAIFCIWMTWFVFFGVKWIYPERE